MSTPDWLRWTLAVAMVAVALYHLCRLAAVRWPSVRLPASVHAGGPVSVDVELTHAAMGAGMTAMVLDVVDPAGLRGLGLVFGAGMIWFAARAVHGFAALGPRGADVPARQAIGCAAMAYMLVVLAAPSAVAGTMTGAMNGMSMSSAGSSVIAALSSPVLRVLVAGVTVGVAGWILHLRARPVVAGPALSLGCQLAVSMTTVYMLVAM